MTKECCMYNEPGLLYFRHQEKHPSQTDERARKRYMQLRETLFQQTLIAALSHEELVGKPRLDARLQLVRWWFLIDQDIHPKHRFAYNISRQILHSHMKSRTTFANCSVQQFTDVCFLVETISKLPTGSHRYYVLFKAYDLLPLIPFMDLPLVWSSLMSKSIMCGHNHPLHAKICQRILERIQTLTGDVHWPGFVASLNFLSQFHLTRIDPTLLERASDKIMKVLNRNTEQLTTANLVTASLIVGLSTEKNQSAISSLLQNHLKQEKSHLIPANLLRFSTQLLEASWVSDELGVELSAIIRRSVRAAFLEPRADKLTGVFPCLSRLFIAGVIDEEIFHIIFNNPSLCELNKDGKRSIQKKILYPGTGTSVVHASMLLMLSGIVHTLHPQYQGANLDIAPYAYNRPEGESFDTLKVTYESVHATLESAMMTKFSQNSSLFLETALLPNMGETNFLFGLRLCDGKFIEIPEDLKLQLRVNGWKTPLPEGVKWVCLTLGDRRLCHSGIVNIWNEGYKKKNVCSFFIEFRELRTLTLDQVDKFLSEFISDSWSRVETVSEPGLHRFPVNQPPLRVSGSA